MVAILVAAAIDTGTTVVANTNTIQIALATIKRGQNVAKGSNSKNLGAYCSSSGGGTGEARGAAIGGNEEINVISGGGGRGDDCQIYR